MVSKMEFVTNPVLGMKVYHKDIYDGNEKMTVVGVRENSVELRGDYSGGTHNVVQESWLPIQGTFRLRRCCPNANNPSGCPLPNVHCGYPDCEPYI